MSLNKNVVDVILLLLIVVQAGLIGYKISKLIMKHKLEKKLNVNIKWADEQTNENTQHRNDLQDSIYDMDLTDTEKEAKLYRTANLWQKDINRYTVVINGNVKIY